ncbi:NADPH:quinone reductase [Parafrankia colletiae]|uniref:NADPH:quinone reductase n=1 Tax=Parafrankia colletiae TaxID=573497 RepID=A0A1S1QJ80_9ACTN|nr:NAD(P)-dependent alcohol dehydrogenase [Parafrankia colletiae]MCK9901798.1 NAD(P)-dependent alcohol dehydrogenase [Frankia sp. Cpl3]OHV34030.1 NADPH:quinone reductase [Parafrankia colletiae]
MKAIVQERFGPPDVLRLADVDIPEPGPDDVLVAVRAAALNPYDWHMLRGDPLVARLFGGMGLTRPKSLVAGLDAAGRVEAVGRNVTGLRPGDEVLGYCPGAFAEYALTSPEMVVPKPAALSFEQAAALPIAATTALRGIRDVGRVRAGQRVLVNGAAGGVGTFAVQLAAASGAEVTGVCGTANVDLVASLGASSVVDHTSADFTDTDDPYDVILDNVGNRPLRQLRGALVRNGTLVVNAGGSPGHVFGAVGSTLRAVAVNCVVRQRLTPLPDRRERSFLLAVTDAVEKGTLSPVLDRMYPLADVAEGLRHVERGHARGKVVVTVA